MTEKYINIYFLTILESFGFQFYEKKKTKKKKFVFNLCEKMACEFKIVLFSLFFSLEREEGETRQHGP
jgi:hypothetical protein